MHHEPGSHKPASSCTVLFLCIALPWLHHLCNASQGVCVTGDSPSSTEVPPPPPPLHQLPPDLQVVPDSPEAADAAVSSLPGHAATVLAPVGQPTHAAAAAEPLTAGPAAGLASPTDSEATPVSTIKCIQVLAPQAAQQDDSAGVLLAMRTQQRC